MPQLQVIVPKLNKRSFPVEDTADKSNITGVVFNGFSFHSITQQTNNSGTWFQDVNGSFYWGGGLSDIDQSAELNLVKIQDVDYSNLFTAYTFDWLKTNGTGTTISIIDTGITPDNAFYNNFKQEIISGTNAVLHHGNFIGGILCGKKSINGLAKNTMLHSIKYKSDGEDIAAQLNNFIQALTKISLLNDSVILNISQGFNSQAVHEKFRVQEQQIINLIQQISAQKNKLIICAADDNSAINDILFPGNMKECISVGCIDEFSTDVVIKVKLDILTPMVNYASYDNSFNQIMDSGSSFSTAVISSLAACYLSKKGSITQDAFLSELKSSSTNRKDFNYGNAKAFQYQIT